MSERLSNSRVQKDAFALHLASQFLPCGIELIDTLRQGRKILQQGKISDFSEKYFLYAEELGHFVLKALPPYASEPNFFKAVVRYQQALRAEGLPLPSFCPTLADAQCYHHVTNRNGQRKLFTLQQMTSGHAMGHDENVVDSIMCFLRQFHAVSASFSDLALPRRNLFDSILQLFSDGLQEIKLKYPNNWKIRSKDVILLAETYREEVVLQRDHAYKLGYLSATQPVHGDFHADNILLTSSGTISALLDFDDAKFDNPIQDVARFAASVAVFNFHTAVDTPFEKVPSGVNVTLLRHIVTTYFKGNAEMRCSPAYFAPAVKCIALQMAFIGLLSGHYDFGKICALLDLPQLLNAQLGE